MKNITAKRSGARVVDKLLALGLVSERRQQKVRVKTRRVRKACQQDRFRAAHLSLLKTSVRACVRKVRTSVGGHVRGGGQEGRGIKYELPLFAQASLLPSCGSRAP